MSERARDPAPEARPPSALRAWAELTRISNLPTVITNALVGTAAACGTGDFPWLKFTATCAAAALLYCAGMVMNDLCDLEVDRSERPGRPLPSGRITVPAARGFVLASLLLAPAGLALLRPGAGLMAAFLAVLIVAYNWFHNVSALSVLLMGMCRAAVYGVAIFAVADRPPIGFEYPAAALAAYLVLLSVVARREATWQPIDVRWPAWILPLIPLPIAIPIAFTSAVSPAGRWLALGAALLFVLWALYGVSRLYKLVPRVVQAVLIWLAGICLLDAIWLALMPRSELVLVALACFVVTVWSHRRILGT